MTDSYENDCSPQHTVRVLKVSFESNKGCIFPSHKDKHDLGSWVALLVLLLNSQILHCKCRKQVHCLCSSGSLKKASSFFLGQLQIFSLINSFFNISVLTSLKCIHLFSAKYCKCVALHLYHYNPYPVGNCRMSFFCLYSLPV